MMICQALSTLARYELNSVIFVMNNVVYAIEQVFVDVNAFKPRHQFDEFDILPKWDYQAVAQSYGANYLEAETACELKDVLKELRIKTKRPTLVDITIPQKDQPNQMKRLVDPPKIN